MNYTRSIICIALITAVVSHTPVYAKMYRWTNDQGNVIYSDKVPPKESKLERHVLNTKGHVIETIRAAKTKEQIALENRLKHLRREQEKIIARQKANDKVLLSTFRNIDDLRMTLNGKLQSVDAQKRVHERSLENFRENLALSRKKAAKTERSARKVPVNILNEIASNEEKIHVTYLDIDKTIEKRKAIQTKFDKDIKRFLFLTKNSDISAQELSDETAENKAANILGLYNCKNQEACEQAWATAKQFVVLNSTTQINFNTDSLIMGNDPMLATDISLSASKSKRQNNKVSIFLDIRCHQSTLGIEFCQSEKVKHIRQSFRSYIESKLSNVTVTI